MVSLWFTEHRDDELLWQWLIKDPIVIVSVLIAYLFFVLKWGPAFMRDRQPYELRSVMLIYNATQVVYNLILVYMCLDAMLNGAREPNNWMCVLSDERTLRCARLYVLNKYMDLTDTVIFVLRKKHAQISFLHVFHHVVMIAWPALTLHMPGTTDGEAHQGGLINCGVHVIMYSYYFACIYGERLKVVTAFVKRRVTQIQLVQFVMLLFVFGRGTFGLCHYAPYFSAFAFWLNVVFFGLFLQMYVQFYLKGRSKKPVK